MNLAEEILYAGAIIGLMTEIIITIFLSYTLIKKTIKNHIKEGEWKLVIMSLGIYLGADALYDCVHLIRALTMKVNTGELSLFTIVPGYIVGAAAIFMLLSLRKRAEYMDIQIGAQLKKKKGTVRGNGR